MLRILNWPGVIVLTKVFFITHCKSQDNTLPSWSQEEDLMNERISSCIDDKVISNVS